jgi:MFS family permease
MAVQLAGGLTGIIATLGLNAMGVGPVAIGVTVAMNGIGYCIGSWTAPRALSAFGHIRLFAATSALNAIGMLTLYLVQEPLWWACFRLIQGLCFAYMFTSLESWLGAAAPKENRGNLVGLYHTVAKVSLMIGPFFIAGLKPLDPEVFIWASLFLTLSLVPVCLTRQVAPPEPAGRRAMSFAELYRLAPAALIGACVAGLANTGTTALLPLYFEGFDLAGGGTAATAIAGGAIMLGAIFSQWPAGVISDRVDRRLVIAVMTGVAGAGALAAAAMLGVIGELGMIGCSVIWGIGALSFYGVCAAHAIDRTPKESVGEAMSAVLFAWAAGSILGPILSGVAMNVAGPRGLYALSGCFLLALATYMLIRVRQRPAARPSPGKPDWDVVTPTPLASVPLEAEGLAGKD